jgi:hypothetical protein
VYIHILVHTYVLLIGILVPGESLIAKTYTAVHQLILEKLRSRCLAKYTMVIIIVPYLASATKIRKFAEPFSFQYEQKYHVGMYIYICISCSVSLVSCYSSDIFLATYWCKFTLFVDGSLNQWRPMLIWHSSLTQNTSGKDQKKEICPGHPTFRRLERSATVDMPGRASTAPPHRRPSFEEELGCFCSFFSSAKKTISYWRRGIFPLLS